MSGRSSNTAALARVARGLPDAGRMRPHVCAELPLSRSLEGFDWISSRRAIGKVVIRPDMKEETP